MGSNISYEDKNSDTICSKLCLIFCFLPGFAPRIKTKNQTERSQIKSSDETSEKPYRSSPPMAIPFYASDEEGYIESYDSSFSDSDSE